MFLLTWTHLTSVFCFGSILYTVTLCTFFFYVSELGRGRCLGWVFCTLCLGGIGLFAFFLFLWAGPAVTLWFGHCVFSSFQHRIFFLFFLQLFFFYVIVGRFFFLYDFITGDFFFAFLHVSAWAALLFFANSFFSFLFLIEILASAIFLAALSNAGGVVKRVQAGGYRTIPFFFCAALIVLFWISLLASLCLFFFLFFFFFYGGVGDWGLFDLLIAVMWGIDITSVEFIFFGWNLLLGALFIKLGFAPVFVWKPILFRGLSPLTLGGYVFLYYTPLFYFILFMFTCYFTDILLMLLGSILVWVGLGFLSILGLLGDATYFKIFVACSSILNGLFILLLVSGVQLTLNTL